MQGESLEEIDAFVEKATVLERAVRDIANGTFDEKNASLKKYGILTPEEIAEEEAREAKKKEDCLRRKREKEILMKEQESRKWWEGAKLLFGPKDSCERGTPKVSAHQNNCTQTVISKSSTVLFQTSVFAK